MITARVSNVSAFARWKADPDSDVDWLINSIISDTQTEAMAKGTAFHKVLEYAQDGSDITQVTEDGYTFAFTLDTNLYLPPMREYRLGKDYGDIWVSGQVDAIIGKAIFDHKTTEWFDAENYLTSKQHSFYMDIFGADQFTWYIWECKKIDPLPPVGFCVGSLAHDAAWNEYDAAVQDDEGRTYEVFALHQLTQYRYPEMEAECRELAQEYRQFAERWLTGPTPFERQLKASMEAQ